MTRLANLYDLSRFRSFFTRAVPRLRLSQKGFVLIAVPLLFEVAIFTSMFVALEDAERQVALQSRARSATAHCSMITKLIVGVPASLYLYRSTGADEHLIAYENKLAQFRQEFASLLELLKNEPRELMSFAVLKEVADRFLMYLDECRLAVETGDHDKVAEYIGHLRYQLKLLTSRIEEISIPYKQLEEESGEQQEKARTTLKTMLVVAIALSFLLAAGLWLYFKGDTARRLAVLLGNTRRFAQGQVLSEPLQGADELAELDGVFHSMAETINRANLQRQEFMAMIAHDLRSPLSAVLMSLDRLRSEAVAERRAEILETNERSLHRLINLISDLLDAEQLRAGKMDMNFEVVPIAHVLENAYQAVRGLAEKGQVVMEMPSADVEVETDPDRLVQVLVNLLSNALKFSPPGSTIAVSVVDDGNWLELRVTDQGPGILPEDQKVIFQRYMQSQSGPRKKGGSGLGLAICEAIIRAHQGSIGVESEFGKGSTFWFKIPLTQGGS